MDFSMVQNVSAAALRSKGRNYTTRGLTSAEPVKVIASQSAISSTPKGSTSSPLRIPEMQAETRAAVQSASVGIQKRQGLATYASLIRTNRENRFRTRYDLLI